MLFFSKAPDVGHGLTVGYLWRLSYLPLFCIPHSLFVWSLYVVKSTADLFDDDEEGDLFKEKPAIPSVVAGTSKETESRREAIMEKKVMAYIWIIWLRF